MQDVLTEMSAMCGKLDFRSERISELSIRTKAMPVIRKLCSHPITRQLICELIKKDRYTYRHCIGVAIVSYGIGMWSGMEEEAVQELAIAGFLHDIGKIKVPDSILKKAAPLTMDEYNEMSLHTFMGFDLLCHIPGMEEQQALVALQHHEREDGSGYPFGIAGGKITGQSKAVAIADVFHTMISERVYKQPVSLFRALREIYETAIPLFDVELVHCFVFNIMNRAIDSEVLLSNGQVGRIVRLHADDLIHPIVHSSGTLFDTRRSKLEIVDFSGGDPNARSCLIIE